MLDSPAFTVKDEKAGGVAALDGTLGDQLRRQIELKIGGANGRKLRRRGPINF